MLPYLFRAVIFHNSGIKAKVTENKSLNLLDERIPLREVHQKSITPDYRKFSEKFKKLHTTSRQIDYQLDEDLDVLHERIIQKRY